MHFEFNDKEKGLIMQKTPTSLKAKLMQQACVFAWAATVTLTGFFLGIRFTWIYSLAVPLSFLMQGTEKEKAKTIFCGGVTGMLLAYLMCLAIGIVTPHLGDRLSFLIFVPSAVAILMFMMPVAPRFFNNVGFIYLIVCTADPNTFCANFIEMLLSFLIGGIIYLGGMFTIVYLLRSCAKKKSLENNG